MLVNQCITAVLSTSPRHISWTLQGSLRPYDVIVLCRFQPVSSLQVAFQAHTVTMQPI